MNKNLFLLALVGIFASALAAVPECPEDEDHAIYFPDDEQCGIFYECFHGEARLHECPSGLYWDVRRNICDRDADCGTKLTSTEGPPPSSEPTPPSEPSPPSPPEPSPSPEPTPDPEPPKARRF